MGRPPKAGTCHNLISEGSGAGIGIDGASGWVLGGFAVNLLARLVF